ncbi:hypothetical protein [Variovorax sp. DXTD-1]|uniref:hypothetical protein n=1 Tax=Variovorax sp. DXTD-1 TaxID=2495592 RepID=UPI000F87A4F9|nr:hypothetical protein [Variovorax sp. DXTD-1]RST54104.1 hypothetical protein EJI00_02970 [Variovorax sp. DXTD-1]
MIPAWCDPTSDPANPVEGSSGSGNVEISSPYYASLAGDTTGLVSGDVLWTSQWNGGAPAPDFSGTGSFSYPFSCEVAMWSGMPADGTLTITCWIHGVEQQTQLFITFNSAAQTAAWGISVPFTPEFWTGFVNTYEVP